jgi:hypothetical protein
MEQNKQQINDLILHYTNLYGWVNYDALNKQLQKQNYEIVEREYHNNTDGEVHYKYTNIRTGDSYELLANYWDVSSFDEFKKWLAKQ